MRWMVVGLMLSAGCGGGGKSEPPEWAGRWKTAAIPLGSVVAMTLSGSETTVSGSGTQSREAGTPVTFTISGDFGGTPAGTLKFTYAANSSESFNYSQPDVDHLTLANAQRTLNFTRQ